MIIYKNRNLVIPVGLGPNFNKETVEIKNENKAVTITENGTEIVTYDPAEYTGLGIVQINTEVQGQSVQPSAIVDITENGKYDVFPDEGYDSIAKVEIGVNIDTSTYYREGYSNGYSAGEADGISEGIAKQKSLLDSSTFTQNGTYTREDGWNEITVDIPGINNQNKTVDSSTKLQILTADPSYTGLGTVIVNPYELDSKTVDPSTNSQTITSEKDGLSSVTINPYVLDSKTVDSSTKAQVVTSDADGLRSVTINPYVLSELEVDSSTSTQTRTGQFGTVTINPYVLDSSSAVIDQNGEYVFTSNQAGLSRVDVSVNIDTQSYYDNGYSDGESAGITEGIAAQKALLDSSTFRNNGTFTRENGWNEITVDIDTVNNQSKTVDSSTNSQIVIFDPEYTGLSSVTVNPYELDSKTVDPSTNRQIITSSKDGLSSVTINPYVLDSKTVDPSTNQITVTSSADGLNSVTVNAVTSSIDNNITAGNIKNGVSILGVQGTYSGVTVNNQNKTVDSSTFSQVISYDEGYTGLGTVTINPYSLEDKVHVINYYQFVDSDVKASTFTVKPKDGYDGMSKFTAKNVPILRSVTLNPSASSNVSWNYHNMTYVKGVGTVTVPKVTSSIDTNIQAGNIKSGVTILGVKGTYSGTTINNQNKTVDASTNQQSVTYDSGYTGLGTVTVNAYDIDSCYILAASI